MARFRKKPVEIEAHQLPDPRESQEERVLFCAVAHWCGGEVAEDEVDDTVVLIDTLEGQMRAKPGDWIIRGVHGEFYPCDQAVFAATYDLVEG